MPIYIVRFWPKDKGPVEEYYYHEEEAARYHYNLFPEEELDELYEKVELIRELDVEPLDYKPRRNNSHGTSSH